MFLITVYEYNQDPRTYEISTKRKEARAKAQLVASNIDGFAVLYDARPFGTLCEVYESNPNQPRKAA